MLSTTILIVGSGPTGLWLAYELRSWNSTIDVLVIDTIPSRSKRMIHSKALSFSAGSLETFTSRGVAQPFLDSSARLPRAHFAGLPTMLNLDVLGAQYPFNVAIPQTTTENILLGLCDGVGVRFAWGAEFESFVQDGDGVAVTARKAGDEVSADADGKIQIKAKWVIGCDGTHSKVRQSAGIKFEGTPSTISSDLVDVQLERKPPTGMVIGKGGALLIPIGDGVRYRTFQLAHTMATDDTGIPHMDGVRAFLQQAFGDDYGAHSLLWISRFGNACRTVSSFREDRVFLAGDAAHQLFPAGGQGMNFGFQDATSLAWRLAMVENGVLPTEDLVQSLLDSYNTERLVITQSILHNVQAQMALFKYTTPSEMAIRDVFSEMLRNPDINTMWARRLTGFGDPPEAFGNTTQEDKLVGTRLTKLICGDMVKNVFRVTTLEKFVLLKRDRGEETDLEGVSRRWSNCVTELPSAGNGGDGWVNLDALLIRPDMRIAWAARSKTPQEEIQTSLISVLEHWFGVRA